MTFRWSGTCSFAFLGNGTMPFADTAAYFENRASHARPNERRQELAESARFYRELANITPSFPPGYKGAKLPETADRTTERRRSLRWLTLFETSSAKQRMLRLARRYAQ